MPIITNRVLRSNIRNTWATTRQQMATADVEVSDPTNEDSETEALTYPLGVDYCGLCSMPPEVSTRAASFIRIGVVVEHRKSFSACILIWNEICFCISTLLNMPSLEDQCCTSVPHLCTTETCRATGLNSAVCA